MGILWDGFWIVLFLAGLMLYYSKLRVYKFKMEGKYGICKKKLGKTLTSYPNGWFVMCQASELAKGQVK